MDSGKGQPHRPHPGKLLGGKTGGALKSRAGRGLGKPLGLAEWMIQAGKADLCLDGPGGCLPIPSLPILL